MVRSLGTMHEYVKRKLEEEGDEEEKSIHLQMIDAVKWVPVMMNRPKRSKTSADIVTAVRTAMAGRTGLLEPRCPAGSGHQDLKMVLDAVARSLGLDDARAMMFSASRLTPFRAR